jgi:PIN domain nuclease of toxin-antitoxin system
MGSLSMKYLLDTHTWVWWNMRPQNLSRKVTKLIENEAEYDELLYVQSLW